MDAETSTGRTEKMGKTADELNDLARHEGTMPALRYIQTSQDVTLECARELLDQVLTDETRKITEDRTFSANQED